MSTTTEAPGLRLLREKRVNMGLSLRKAGPAIGINWKTLASAERGESVPQAAHRAQIARFYGCEPVDFWPVTGEDRLAA